MGVAFSICDAYSRGSAGALDLAEVTLGLLDNENNFKLLYDDNLSIKEKIEKMKETYKDAQDYEYEHYKKYNEEGNAVAANRALGKSYAFEAIWAYIKNM